MSAVPVLRRSHGFLPQEVLMERRADDAILLNSAMALQKPAEKTSQWLHHWATETPQALFLAERAGDNWRELTYAETLARTRALAGGLLALGLGPSRPLAVLSGNSIEHALLALATQYAGIPLVPLAEQYSLIPAAHARLLPIIAEVKPGAVYVADAARFAQALAHDVFQDVTVICGTGALPGSLAFSGLLKPENHAAVDAANAAVGPDTLAKIIFTSGSTSTPKGVLTTQRMLCANQAQMGQVWPFLDAQKPVILDWLPWNHVFGGSHNFNLMLAHGGALYIDDGRPAPGLFERTIKNIKSVRPTISFNVPLGYGLLVEAMEKDADLRRAFFDRLDLVFYAGASLSDHLWQKLEAMAMAEKGVAPLMSSSWGMTETAPASLMVHEVIDRAGVVGVPLPGVTIKLLPDPDMRCEVRVKGPNVMPGYFKDPERSAAAFDAEGYLITGDAMRFRDSAAPERGLVFDGRISEDFKLATGTWVHVSKLRATALAHLAPLAADLVVTGHDRNEIGILVFPSEATRKGLAAHAEDRDGLLANPDLLQALRDLLAGLAKTATGSSNRILRAAILSERASLAEGEATDKGNLNQQKILRRRAALVDRLYAGADPAVVILEKIDG